MNNVHTVIAPWHGLGGQDGPKGGCLQPELPTVPPLCLPVDSQAVGEVLHEWVQAGEGEDRQDSKG